MLHTSCGCWYITFECLSISVCIRTKFIRNLSRVRTDVETRLFTPDTGEPQTDVNVYRTDVVTRLFMCPIRIYFIRVFMCFTRVRWHGPWPVWYGCTLYGCSCMSHGRFRRSFMCLIRVYAIPVRSFMCFTRVHSHGCLPVWYGWTSYGCSCVWHGCVHTVVNLSDTDDLRTGVPVFDTGAFTRSFTCLIRMNFVRVILCSTRVRLHGR